MFPGVLGDVIGGFRVAHGFGVELAGFIQDLLFEYGLEYHGRGSGIFQFSNTIHGVGKSAAADDNGILEFQAHVGCGKVHECLLMVMRCDSAPSEMVA